MDSLDKGRPQNRVDKVADLWFMRSSGARDIQSRNLVFRKELTQSLCSFFNGVDRVPAEVKTGFFCSPSYCCRQPRPSAQLRSDRHDQRGIAVTDVPPGPLVIALAGRFLQLVARR